MLAHLARTWRIYSDERARSALAIRLGPHLARDIGIDGTNAPLDSSAETLNTDAVLYGAMPPLLLKYR